MQPIRRLILKELVVLFGLLALVSAGLAWFGINRILDQQLALRSREDLVRLATDIRKDLANVERVGRSAARWWQDGVLKTDTIQLAEAQLAPLLEEYPEVANLVLITTDGWGLSMSRLPDGLSTYHLDARKDAALKRYLRKGGRRQVDPTWEPTPFKVFQRPWFLTAQEAPGPRWVEAYRFANLPTHGLTYTLPLRDAQGRFRGALCADIFLDSLSERTWAIQPTVHSQALVSDADGKALVLPKGTLPALNQHQSSPFLSPISPDFLPLFHGLLMRWEALGRPQNLIRLRHDRKGYTCFVQALEGVEGVQWLLSLAVPDQDYRGAANRVAMVILAAGVVASILAAWRAARTAHRISDPLEALAEAARLLGGGTVPAPAPSNIVELETLGEALHRAGLALEKELELRLQLQHSQRLETVGTLTGGIAHDVNNQLAAIVGQIHLGRELLPAEHPTLLRLDRAEDAAHRCAQMIRTLLGFTHRGRPEVTKLDLNRVVIQTAGLLERLLGGRIRLDLKLGANLPPVLAEMVSLEQVIMNLAVNARDAMPEGGSLVIATTLSPNGEACLAVRDSGIGIPPEHLARIFEPFFTTKAVGKGTGLGLSMVLGLIKAQGGRVEVQSQPGEGTEFQVFLTPTQPPGELAQIPTERDSQADLQSLMGRRILIVDDEAQIRDLLKEAFLGWQAQVDTAPDGLKAWALWQECPYDLVVSDQRMPELTGLQLLTRIRASGSNAPVILVSGYGLESLDQALAEDQKLQFLMKPFKLVDLFAAARRSLEGN